MTERDKAKSLVDEFYQYTNTNSRENAKSCAKILAKEVIVKLKYNKVMKFILLLPILALSQKKPSFEVSPVLSLRDKVHGIFFVLRIGYFPTLRKYSLM